MAPTTEDLDIPSFYDWLSRDYDRMTAFDQRFVRERPFIKLLVDNYHITKALDAGTGTGFHALLLAQLGVEVTAVDISPAMVEALMRRALSMDLVVTPLVAPFQDLPALVTNPQDAVFSMGNTLAHSESRKDLLSTLTAFRRLLRPGGVLFAQVLNYRKILSTRERMQIVREAGPTKFVRWYEYSGDRIRFHITQEELSTGKMLEEKSVELRPVLDDELRQSLSEAGFGEIRIHGGITMEPFDALNSKDCVVLALHP